MAEEGQAPATVPPAAASRTGARIEAALAALGVGKWDTTVAEVKTWLAGKVEEASTAAQGLVAEAEITAKKVEAAALAAIHDLLEGATTPASPPPQPGASTDSPPSNP